tara:strand:+ start:49 stop:894 length:846 start_codon:yes stop_codon:yes gene_type:complete
MIKGSVVPGFTAIPNEVITDGRITPVSFRVITYLLSKPGNWQVRVKDIQNTLSLGRDSVYNALNNLTDSGYISKVKMRDQGRFLKFQYKLTYKPTISWKSGSGKPGNGSSAPFPEKPYPANQDPSNKEYIYMYSNNKRIKEKKKEEKKTPKPPKGAPTNKFTGLSLDFYSKQKQNGIRFTPFIKTQEKAVSDGANTLRLLHERDGYSEEDIKKILTFVNNSDFWMKNFKSLPQARQKGKFDTVFNQMQTTKGEPKKDIYNEVTERDWDDKARAKIRSILEK